MQWCFGRGKPLPYKIFQHKNPPFAINSGFFIFNSQHSLKWCSAVKQWCFNSAPPQPPLRTIPRKTLSHLPPLSKGGGLTARHKLLLCCFLLAICPPFLYCKLFCRQDGGIALHHRPFQNRTIPRKRGGSVARSSRANYGGDCSCLEVVSLIPLVVSLFHIDRCIDLNSEPEKCYLAKRTIGSLLS